MSGFRGIFAWEKAISRQMFVDADGTIDAYKFPLIIKTGLLEDPKYGHIFFKSKESVCARRKNLEEKRHLEVSGPPGAKELVLSLFVTDAIFCEIGSEQCASFLYPWAKTVFNNKEVFLFDDAFIENGLITDDSGEKTSVCLLPFSECGPLKYLNAEGGYDFSEIATWDVYRVDNVAYFEEDPI